MQSHQVIDDFAQLVEADSTVFVQGPYRPLLALTVFSLPLTCLHICVCVCVCTTTVHIYVYV
jgi:hypothetical protein